MWVLSREKGESLCLIDGKVFSVGRKAGDLVLAGDQSVSRQHAYLQVATPPEAGVTLWDTCSKFGTFVNDGIAKQSKIGNSEKVTLKAGDRVRFGCQHNTWTLECKLCVCTSSLKSNIRAELGTLISQVGGKLVDKWTEESSHLVMDSITLTIKVVCALACGKPIVTPTFWQQYKDFLRGLNKCPNIANFIPPRNESLNHKDKAFLPNPRRKTLFENKLFVFPNPLYLKKFGSMVSFAGGKAVELSTCGISITDLCEPNVVVLQDSGPESEFSVFYRNIVRNLRDRHLRVIPEKDIGLAILDVSVDAFCNPSYDSRDVLRKPSNLCLDSEGGTVLAINTEEETPTSRKFGSHHEVSAHEAIPPTLSPASELTEHLFQPSLKATASDTSCTRKRSRNASSKEENFSEDSGSVTMDSSHFRMDQHFRDDGNSSLDVSGMSTSSVFSEQQKSKVQANRASFPASSKVNAWPSTSITDDGDDFIIPSPPKRKKRKLTAALNNPDDADMFDFPAEPSSSNQALENDDDDIFGFGDKKKSSLLGNKINKPKTSDRKDLSASRDLFDNSDDVFLSTQASKKRKSGTDDIEMEGPQSKKTIRQVGDPLPKSEPGCSTHVCKNAGSSVKQESNSEDLDSEEARFIASLRDKMVLETVSLISRQVKLRHDASTPNCATKNFKKFRKAWVAPAERVFIRNENMCNETVISVESRRAPGGYSSSEEESGIDDPTPRPNGRVNGQADEWEFIPFSQM